MRLRNTVTVCVLLHRDGRWVLNVRSPHAAWAPGVLGLVGGHVEQADGVGVLEDTGRREVREETGIDLTGVPLVYLESAAFVGEGGVQQITVTFLAAVPRGIEPRLTEPDEMTAVGWWNVAEAAADPRAMDWLAPLLSRAEQALGR